MQPWGWMGQTREPCQLHLAPGPFTQRGGKKYILTLIVRINNRLTKCFLCTILSYCVMSKKKIKGVELLSQYQKRGDQFSLSLAKSSKMKNLLSLEKVHPWKNHFERLWDIKLAWSYSDGHLCPEKDSLLMIKNSGKIRKEIFYCKMSKKKKI